MSLYISKLLAKSGLQSLICLMLAVFAGLGLCLLDSQVQVFSFGDSSFDARFFPRIVLVLIVVLALLSGMARAKKMDEPIGSFVGWARVFLVVGVIGLALWFMPSVGFLLSSFVVASVTAFVLGERDIRLYVGLPLLIAAIVTFGAQYGLTIPLP
ncbi:MAG: tripartite tricarboxylate transporter TctB family protein [Oceanospirillaceae bacterium]|nr:tripartite tricarboxylate transporter TctB family protein [Oceanospirillaceae bacterium]